ncbi:hypothetical protein CROQUDRAFT_658922 [Cronartium quercuum f. sp. fusiforme G11]|uniref:Uncharacterized protein n=1 Tax=Cronartium quercuum f. sp. fusiforme G11 TaxID=708437 RepID=A0A9P6NFX4_9BASI|nr:hypothetical protein CROQUDRAFT_658922 [Cronartium quercuum f. sp. fusiforme G11]
MRAITYTRQSVTVLVVETEEEDGMVGEHRWNSAEPFIRSLLFINYCCAAVVYPFVPGPGALHC